MGSRRHVHRERRPVAAEVLLPVHVPVPERQAAHGPRAQLHHRRRHRRATCACAATTCCSRWAGTPSGCRPRTPPSRTASRRRSGPTTTSPTCAAAEVAGLRASTGRASSPPACPTTTAGTSGCSCACSRSGIAYKTTGIVNWDPGRPDRARERAGHRRARLAHRRDRREARDPDVLPADHRLRAKSCSPRSTRLPGWPDACAPCSELDRPQRGREHLFPVRASAASSASCSVFTTRADTLMGVTFVAVAAEHPLAELAAGRDRERCALSSTSASAAALWKPTLATMEKKGMRDRARRPPSADRRSGAGLGRQLRAHGLRRGRGDGRAGARRARLRVREEIRPADPSR